MRTAVILSVFAAVLAWNAVTATALTPVAMTVAPPAPEPDYRYGWMTARLPGTGIVAANVVREPAFSGESGERMRAVDTARAALESEYCRKGEGGFVVDPGLIVFDAGPGEWVVGGSCL